MQLVLYLPRSTIHFSNVDKICFPTTGIGVDDNDSCTAQLTNLLCRSSRSALYGGRWNPVGLPALYRSASFAISALEKFVHIGSALLPPLVLVVVDIAEHSQIFSPAVSKLPFGWDELPTSVSAQSLGRNGSSVAKP